MVVKLTKISSIILLLTFMGIGCSDDDDDITTGPVTVTGLQVATTSSAPVVDGTIDAVWSTATAFNVTVGTDPAYQNAFGAIPVTLKAVSYDSKLYILAQWSDRSVTESITKKQWQFSGGSWSKADQDEDRFFVMFDAGNNGTEGANCASMCHQPSAGLMATTGGGNVDVWHWKAARTNPSVKADDKWWDGAGRGSDAGTGSVYADNLIVINNVEKPKYMHATLTTAYTGDFLFASDTAQFDSTLDWTGATIPFYVIDPTATGSRWDVSAKGVYSGGIWTLEMCRETNTGNSDDVVLGTGSVSMTIAITDNSGGDHSGRAPFDLIF